MCTCHNFSQEKIVFQVFDCNVPFYTRLRTKSRPFFGLQRSQVREPTWPDLRGDHRGSKPLRQPPCAISSSRRPCGFKTGRFGHEKTAKLESRDDQQGWPSWDQVDQPGVVSDQLVAGGSSLGFSLFLVVLPCGLAPPIKWNALLALASHLQTQRNSQITSNDHIATFQFHKPMFIHVQGGLMKTRTSSTFYISLTSRGRSRGFGRLRSNHLRSILEALTTRGPSVKRPMGGAPWGKGGKQGEAAKQHLNVQSFCMSLLGMDMKRLLPQHLGAEVPPKKGKERCEHGPWAGLSFLPWGGLQEYVHDHSCKEWCQEAEKTK